MYKRKERLGEFVVARCNAPELLDAAEEPLDQIALLVEVTIERTGIERSNRPTAANRAEETLCGFVVAKWNEALRKTVQSMVRTARV